MRGDAHHRHGNSFDKQRLSQNGGIARVAPRPVVVTENGGRRVVLFVVQRKAAASLDPRSHTREEVAANLFPLGLLGKFAVAHRYAAGKAERRVANQLFENISALAQRLECHLGKGSTRISGIASPRRPPLAVGHAHVREAFGVADGQQLHQDRVHHAENRCIRANAKG